MAWANVYYTVLICAFHERHDLSSGLEYKSGHLQINAVISDCHGLYL